MTHLNIQQGLNIEVVSTNLIKKLYEAALSVPEPLEGELDAAYMSGNLLVAKTYRSLVEYLTNRFDDLHINVTAGYYIPFHDSAVNDVLKNTIGDGVGVLDTLFSAVTNLNDLGLVNNTDITDFREGCLLTNSNISTSAGFTNGCSNLDVLGIPPNFSHYTPSVTVNCRPSKLVISDWGKWIATTFANGQSFCDSKHDMCTLNSDNSLTVVKNVTLPEGSNFHNGRYMCGSFFNSTVEEVTLPTTVTRLADFQGSDITTLNFPLNSSLTTIILYCFYGCNKLTLDVSDLPLSITTIEEDAFKRCTRLTGVLDLPNLTQVGIGAFDGTSITSVTDLGSITALPQDAFVNCTSLTSVTLPNTCTSIGNLAFADDSNLSSIDLSNVVTIGVSSFNGCTSLGGTLNLPNLISLGSSAFLNCTGITSVVNLGSVTSIPTNCFNRCSSLSKIVLPTTVTYLGERWCNGTPSSIYIEGLDNVSSHYTYNWYLDNKIIRNPIKTSLTSELSMCKSIDNGTSNIHSLYLPNELNTLVGRQLTSAVWFTEFLSSSKGGTRMTIGLLYYKDLTSFGEATFKGCTIYNLVINNTTPPTHTLSTDSTYIEYSAHQVWSSALFPTGNDAAYPNIGTLWVPDSAVATYQADPLYSGLTIKGINTKTNGVDYDLPRYATYADWKTAEAAAVAQGGHAPQGLIEAWM